MSELRIVRGNDFTTLFKITAMYADGVIVPDFNLQECTDVQVIVHKSMGPGTASLKKSVSDFGTYTLDEDNVLKIEWDGKLMMLGTYTIEFIAMFDGVDIRSYSTTELVFDIVNTNEEAHVPAGCFVDNGMYMLAGSFTVMFGSQQQADWDQTNPEAPSYIKNKPDVYIKPTGGIPKSDLSQSVQQSLNKANTAYQKPANGIPSTDMTSAVQSSLQKADTAYQKPSTGIPASDIANGVIPDVSNFITRNVNDLVNYYLKSETYTKTEVQGLIAAINQFHYEIYPSTSAVTNPQGNVLYLIGPTGTGNDKYEEYVYANNTWVKIGDTSIDLSGYVTTQALNAALASYSTTSQMNNAIAAALAAYTTTADLNTLLAAKQDVLTFDDVPTDGSNNPVTSDGLHDVFEQIYEDYAKKDGFYENMLVGSSLNLTDTTGAYIAREFFYSPAGGTNDIKTGSAFIKKIKGSTIVWNQFVALNSFITRSFTDGSFTNKGNGTYMIVISNQGGLSDNILCTGNPVSIINGHKVFIKASGNINANITFRINGNVNVPINTINTISETSDNLLYPRLASGMAAGTYNIHFNVFDLTLMFGAGNEPATVAEFEAMFPLDYYDYNAGQLLSFTGDDIKTTGFNQWDEQWELGTIGISSSQNSVKVDSTTQIRSKNKIPVFPSTTYCISCPSTNTGFFVVGINNDWGGTGSVLLSRRTGNTQTFTTNSTTRYIAFSMVAAYGTTYKYDICVNISHNGTKNGTYEEYEQHIKDISFYKSIKDGQGNTLFPYGLLSAGSVYDEVTATKAIKRIGVVDMGSLNWITSVGLFECRYNNLVPNFAKSGSVNFVTPKYTTLTTYIQSQSQAVNAPDKSIMVNYGSGSWQQYSIVVKDTSFPDSYAFKAAMQGVMLYYELAEPIVVDITEQNMAYLVNDWGTEQLLPENTSTPVTTPAMLHVIYGMNAVDTLRNLPKNFLAQADLDRLLTAEGYTFTKTWNVDTQQWSFTITGNSAIDAAKAEINVELDSIQEEIVDIAKPASFSSIPMLCGQPMILFGNGTPQESIVPINWIQFLDGGYNWTGLPSALGQVYINTAVNSGGRYIAVWNGNVLKWVNS